MLDLPEMNNQDVKRELLRHMLATVAYRTVRALENAPEGFGEAGKRPVEILAHMGDLLKWAMLKTKGQDFWHRSTPLPWTEEQTRFRNLLRDFDGFLETNSPLSLSDIKRLMQGPIAGVLTQVGQLAMLRCLAGSPSRSENFYTAEIEAGRVGAEQRVPRDPLLTQR